MIGHILRQTDAAVDLVFLQRGALARMDLSPRAARLSFLALPIAALLDLYIRYSFTKHWSELETVFGPSAQDPVRIPFWVVPIMFVVSWLVMLLAIRLVVQTLNLGQRFPAYVTTFNWTALALWGMAALPLTLAGIGLLPIGLAVFGYAGAVLWALVLRWWLAWRVFEVEAVLAISIAAAGFLGYFLGEGVMGLLVQPFAIRG